MCADWSEADFHNGLRKGRSLGVYITLSQKLKEQFATIKDCPLGGLLALASQLPPAISSDDADKKQDKFTLPGSCPLPSRQ